MPKCFSVRLVAILLCVLSLSSVLAQEAQYGKFVVKKLSSSSFNGRGYTKNGDRKAAHFLVKAFKRNGVLPFSSNGGQYTQNYKVQVNYFPNKMDVSIDNQRLIPGVDYLVDAASPSIKGTFPVVKGTRMDLLDSSTLFGLIRKAEGAFIYMDNSLDSTETKEESQVINQNIEYLQAESALSFKGLILYSPKKLTWTVLPYQSKKPLIELHRKLPTPTSIKLNIESRLDTNYATQNIAGYIKGKIVPDSFIVISAHYDHLGKMGKKTIFYGANDNASGTGFILALMQYFKEHPIRYSIAFLSFSGEELGLKGSEYFVKHPLFDLKKIKFLCNFDMAGTGIDGIQIVNSSIYTRQYERLKAINDSAHWVKEIKQRGEAANSDHYWFYRNGVPSFFFYTLGGVNYHDVYDTYASLPFDAWDNYLRLIERFCIDFQ